MKLSTYIIGKGDTIELLAQQLLGDINQVDTLISLNHLRYPYISDDPYDQYANPKGTVFLVGSYTNPQSITINNINNVNIMPNDTIFLSEGSSYGAGVVQSISGSTITFTSPVQGTYDSGAIVTVFVNQQNITTQVLQTGNTLLYPYTPNATANNTSTNYSLVFGTDWKLDNNGFLVRANNDIATVSGLDNLAQALRNRLQTALGTLMLHPDYGNELYNILGESNKLYFTGLAKYYVQQCAIQDPRIRQAEVTNLTIQEDSVFISLSVIPAGSQDPINMNVTLPIGGVS
ncbi:hypothetical protein DNHGIG_07960 [Collibacillus ludicampi]|uniref:LysM domain-containing protein n=1 Tax=Collibacillus ludicampi TaxID=2771369 RepID=A0AAV4LBL2_9BACL|nr:DUF2634 domain-containing protein [Collibacillus ludicampi]GIM45247.1 hypothetical protein DNHGIG_07960 [Collibacillus ludicampi]